MLIEGLKRTGRRVVEWLRNDMVLVPIDRSKIHESVRCPNYDLSQPAKERQRREEILQVRSSEFDLADAVRTAGTLSLVKNKGDYIPSNRRNPRDDPDFPDPPSAA